MDFENIYTKLNAIAVLWGSDDTIITLHKILLININELLLPRSSYIKSAKYLQMPSWSVPAFKNYVANLTMKANIGGSDKYIEYNFFSFIIPTKMRMHCCAVTLIN